MRANLILVLLIVLAWPVDNSDAQLFGRRRQNRQQSPCPEGEYCPYTPGQAMPSQAQPAPYGYQHLNQPQPQYDVRPVAPEPPKAVQAQPAQPLKATPSPPVAAPAVSSNDPRINAIVKALEKLAGGPLELEAPPETTFEESAEPSGGNARQVVDSIGSVEIIHRDGEGRPVATAVIDLSAFVRQEVGSE